MVKLSESAKNGEWSLNDDNTGNKTGLSRWKLVKSALPPQLELLANARADEKLRHSETKNEEKMGEEASVGLTSPKMAKELSRAKKKYNKLRARKAIAEAREAQIAKSKHARNW